MRILFICPAFQPYCPVAATRPVALAQFFAGAGHDIIVLAAKNPRYDPQSWPDFPHEKIHYVDMWLAQDRAARLLQPLKSALSVFGRGKSEGTAQAQAASDAVAASRPVSPLKAWYYDAFDYAFNYPDSYMGWIDNAKAAGARLIEDFGPDLIYSSAPPHSANVVASALAQRHGIPWVCEYRDLWMDHPYHTPNTVRRMFETRLETRVMRQADGLVAVSEDARRVMASKFKQPVVLSLNGYEPSAFDYAQDAALEPNALTLVYAGSIYPKTRSPKVLFEAIAQLQPAPNTLQVHFYGESGGTVLDLAEKYGVSAYVRHYGTRAHAQILDIERRADVLFMMRWDDPREDGVIPGKIFEYLGARRPVLSVGREEGEVAALLDGRPDTVVTRDIATVKDALSRWITRRRQGRLPDVTFDAADDYTRTAQFAPLLPLINRVAGVS